MNSPEDGRVTLVVLNVDETQSTLHSQAILGTWTPVQVG